MRMAFDLLEEREALRDVWRCVKVENGRLSVMVAGMTMKQELCADNLDFQKIQEVSEMCRVNMLLNMMLSLNT